VIAVPGDLLKTQLTVKGDRTAIRPADGESDPFGTVLRCPVCRASHDPSGQSFAPKTGQNFDAMRHGHLSMNRNEGRTRRTILYSAQNRGPGGDNPQHDI